MGKRGEKGMRGIDNIERILYLPSGLARCRCLEDAGRSFKAKIKPYSVSEGKGAGAMDACTLKFLLLTERDEIGLEGDLSKDTTSVIRYARNRGKTMTKWEKINENGCPSFSLCFGQKRARQWPVVRLTCLFRLVAQWWMETWSPLRRERTRLALPIEGATPNHAGWLGLNSCLSFPRTGSMTTSVPSSGPLLETSW